MSYIKKLKAKFLKAKESCMGLALERERERSINFLRQVRFAISSATYTSEHWDICVAVGRIYLYENVYDGIARTVSKSAFK